jgi:ATP sulfurylase
MKNTTIEPHGGKLVNRILEGEEREEALKRVRGLKRGLRKCCKGYET